MKKNNKGFTLVELIVVIAILGVLMAVLVPQYIQYVEKSRQGTDASMLGEILHAAETENALLTTPNTTNVTVTVAGGAVTITGGSADLLAGIETIIPREKDAETYTLAKKTTSKGANTVTLTIQFDANGVKWVDASQTIIDNLFSGKQASTVKTGGGGGE